MGMICKRDIKLVNEISVSVETTVQNGWIAPLVYGQNSDIWPLLGMANRLLPPVLTRRRIWLACAISLAVDGIQLLLGPLGWWGVDQGLDIVAMILLTLTIGFHPLFLPTFLAEFLPTLDMLPTWTACTFMVIGLRRKKNVPPPQPPGPVIDV
jgi:hypothetical protein